MSYGGQEAAERLRRIHQGEDDPACIFDGCVSTDRHYHGPFPGGCTDPANPSGPPIPFTTEPAPGVRDYNGALLDPFYPIGETW